MLLECFFFCIYCVSLWEFEKCFLIFSNSLLLFAIKNFFSCSSIAHKYFKHFLWVNLLCFQWFNIELNSVNGWYSSAFTFLFEILTKTSIFMKIWIYFFDVWTWNETISNKRRMKNSSLQQLFLINFFLTSTDIFNLFIECWLHKIFQKSTISFTILFSKKVHKNHFAWFQSEYNDFKFFHLHFSHSHHCRSKLMQSLNLIKNWMTLEDFSKQKRIRFESQEETFFQQFWIIRWNSHKILSAAIKNKTR
jgi:hypothetical protein